MRFTGSGVSSSASSSCAAAAGERGVGGGRDDAEARHGLRQQIAQLEIRAGRLPHRLFGAGELDGLGDDVRAVERFAELGGGDVFGGVLRAAVDLPADQRGTGGRRGEVALRRPHHPFAVRAAEDRDQQLAGLEVPQPHGLVVRARDEVAPIGRGRDGPDIALMAHEIAELLAVEAIGGEIASYRPRRSACHPG